MVKIVKQERWCHGNIIRSQQVVSELCTALNDKNGASRSLELLEKSGEEVRTMEMGEKGRKEKESDRSGGPGEGEGRGTGTV